MKNKASKPEGLPSVEDLMNMHCKSCEMDPALSAICKACKEAIKKRAKAIDTLYRSRLKSVLENGLSEGVLEDILYGNLTDKLNFDNQDHVPRTTKAIHKHIKQELGVGK